MAKLTHSHRLVRDEVSSHLDSKGVNFGAIEHEETSAKYSWPDDIRISDAVTHTHQYISEKILDTSGVTVWYYEPPNLREAEREINRVPLGTRVG